jgi:hypothetical protein
VNVEIVRLLSHGLYIAVVRTLSRVEQSMAIEAIFGVAASCFPTLTGVECASWPARLFDASKVKDNRKRATGDHLRRRDRRAHIGRVRHINSTSDENAQISAAS